MVASPTEHHMSDKVHEIAESSKEFVGEHALPTTLSAFSLGVGAGLAIALLLIPHKRDDSNVAQRVGRKVMDALSSAVPDALKPGH